MIFSDISDTAVAVMCDVARASGLDLDADKRIVLDELIAEGLVENAGSDEVAQSAKFAVTRKGQQLLDERGVGVNES